ARLEHARGFGEDRGGVAPLEHEVRERELRRIAGERQALRVGAGEHRRAGEGAAPPWRAARRLREHRERRVDPDDRRAWIAAAKRIEEKAGAAPEVDHARGID